MVKVFSQKEEESKFESKSRDKTNCILYPNPKSRDKTNCILYPNPKSKDKTNYILYPTISILYPTKHFHLNTYTSHTTLQCMVLILTYKNASFTKHCLREIPTHLCFYSTKIPDHLVCVILCAINSSYLGKLRAVPIGP